MLVVVVLVQAPQYVAGMHYCLLEISQVLSTCICCCIAVDSLCLQVMNHAFNSPATQWRQSTSFVRGIATINSAKSA